MTRFHFVRACFAAAAATTLAAALPPGPAQGQDLTIKPDKTDAYVLEGVSGSIMYTATVGGNYIKLINFTVGTGTTFGIDANDTVTGTTGPYGVTNPFATLAPGTSFTFSQNFTSGDSGTANTDSGDRVIYTNVAYQETNNMGVSLPGSHPQNALGQAFIEVDDPGNPPLITTPPADPPVPPPAPEPSSVADCGIVALIAAGLMLKARKRKETLTISA